ncbi:ABC-type multidrug transport system, permease component [Pyrodictium delaneyi]|uniref:ABC-type multidrug transport system, permease component n=1 Tax=Pyrodictium delaneyi TaxID=1273541 RepID=A0A0P0N476_9CREN|nr:ABC transporter permease [Pyrodictium delaneyi]ALL01493.1 ABC-type multidrug transport system, permease component [Pyrodictium delaneyi]OWJ54598.1 hypothetical protein Pdsh_06110 [Pyrodictium delaneyi]
MSSSGGRDIRPSILRSILGIAVLESRWVTRQPGWLIQDAFMALSFALILWAWGGAEAVKSIIIAWIIAGAWSTGINFVGQDIAWARVYGKLQMYIASPVTPRGYLLGLLASHFAVHMPLSIAVLSLIATALDTLGLIPAAVAAGLLLLPCSVFLGLALAMRIRKHTNISAITNPIAMILIMLPPVFYPLAALPAMLQPIALMVPTAAAAELARSLAGYYAVYQPQLPALVLVMWNIAALVVASRTIKWGHE